MISRRNIRVKVMQTLYTIDSISNDMKPDEPLGILTSKINRSRDLFAYLIYFITEVARYAEIDARLKASKHLPSASDLNVNTKISGNSIIWTTLENKSFSAAVKNGKFEHTINREILKRIYNQLVATDAYKEYIELPSREKKWERKILEQIFNTLMLPNEEFINHLEDHFINWDDDAELMQTLVQNYLAKTSDVSFVDILSEEKWNFAKELLRTVIDKNEFSLELIKPKLNNWDADRIAALDLILLQMGVCEFLYFETIPTKVTINEYIDLAKEYSTPQSGQFVNGLLDNLHKELSSQNKIHKKSFKNSII
jgi:N utilization substance protein B